MPPDSAHANALHPVELDDLERRFDGCPPTGAVRVARLGRVRAAGLDQTALHGHHASLAADARGGAARRRAVLVAEAACSDLWLARLAHTLAHHRTAAVRVASPVLDTIGLPGNRPAR